MLPARLRLPRIGRLPSAKAVTSGAPTAVTGLIWPSNGATNGDIRLVWSGAALSPFTPMTYIWRIRLVQQAGYYTTFFRCHNDPTLNVGMRYYGFHAYPDNGLPDGTTHKWEVSANGNDYVTGEGGYTPTVVKGSWFTQGARVRVNGSNYEFSFYPELPDTSKKLVYIFATANYSAPGTDGLVLGGAPWSLNQENLSGTFRAFQIYDDILSESDMVTESANHSQNAAQTAAGITALHYINQNPTPSDVTDKSGNGNHPAWANSNRPTLYEA